MATLLPQVTCPHCWHHFEPQDILWVAAHPALRGDPRLGTEAQHRFLPNRFTPRGGALDERNTECTRLACPNCHLVIPRLCLEYEPWVVSIFGAPAAGKSYYLGAMTHMLRRCLPAEYHVSFTDTDAETNQVLSSYEQALFHHPFPEQMVPLGELIAKTPEQGDLYNTARFGTEERIFPKPFLFTLNPLIAHPKRATAPARLLFLYDNAGESFLAGRDSTIRPVTRHLAESSLLLFLFDPTQDQPFRQQLRGHEDAATAARVRPMQQHFIITQAARITREFAHRPDTVKHDKPLVVIVTKQDIWQHLVPGLDSTESMTVRGPNGTGLLDAPRLLERSYRIRQMLLRVTPEVVSAAEHFAQTVLYMGASALGGAPTPLDTAGQWGIQPNAIHPVGVELPILFGLNRSLPELIDTVR